MRIARGMPTLKEAFEDYMAANPTRGRVMREVSYVPGSESAIDRAWRSASLYAPADSTNRSD